MTDKIDLKKLLIGVRGRPIWLSPQVISSLQLRIKNEESSGRLYRAMSNWCDLKGYQGSASLLEKYAKEEYEHADAFRIFLKGLDVLPIEDILPKPKYEFNSLLDVFQQVLQHELLVTQEISDLYKVASTANDTITMELALQYSKEQWDELEKAAKILARLELCGTDMAAILMVDAELGNL